MTTRILVFMSGEMGHTFFGAMRFLQEKLDCELYGIIDRTNSVKQFFHSQKFVNFKQLFFYSDLEPSFHNPDLKYLEDFEKKHSVDLWSIAYMDPTFYKYDEKSIFSSSEILSMIEDDCKFFDKIFSKVNPNFVIMHVGGMKHLNLLEKITPSYGAQKLIFAPAKFGPRYQISTNYELLDKKLSSNQFTTNISKEQIQKIKTDLELYKFYQKNVKKAPHLKKINYILAYLTNFSSQRKAFKNDYSNVKSTYLGSSLALITKQFKKYFRKKYLDKISDYEIPKNEKFVFFPLHSQPEQTISVRAQFCTNQLAVIKNIAQSLPVEYSLYVKEHYFMGILYKWRSKEYYDELKSMPNVKIIHPSVNSSNLYEKCDLVITINGSATYESLFYLKPVIVFTNTSSMDIPSVTKIENFEDLPSLIRKKLSQSNNTIGYEQYFNAKLNETFFIDQSFFHDIFRKFYIHSGSVDDISDKKMAEFLEDYKEILENIATRFLKKIEEFSN